MTHLEQFMTASANAIADTKPVYCPAPGISISRGRQAVAREDFIVRGYGKRSVRIVLLANYNTLENTSKKLSEFELTYLLVAIAEKISKLGWKTGVVDISFGFGAARHGSVRMRNPAGHSVILGPVGRLVEIDHFLNDNYYTPKGFWIK
jgi:hypothetical protein